MTIAGQRPPSSRPTDRPLAPSAVRSHRQPRAAPRPAIGHWGQEWGARLLVATGLLLPLVLVSLWSDLLRAGRLPRPTQSSPIPLRSEPTPWPTALVAVSAPSPAPITATRVTAVVAVATATATAIAPAAIVASLPPAPTPLQPTRPPVPTASARGGSPPTTDETIVRAIQPLPLGADISDGPFLRQEAHKVKGTVYADDRALGEQLAKRFLEAMEVEDNDIAMGDDSRLEEYFTGEALAQRRVWIQRVRQSTDIVTRRIVREHRVMRTLLGSQGDDERSYLVVDAAIKRTQRIRPWRPGRPIEVLSISEPYRTCTSWLFIQVNGVWKLDGELMSRNDSGFCPTGWN